MKRRASALYRRTETYHRGRNGWLAAAVALIFASAPLAVLLWVIPQTGLGIA
ncbi:hypothetical protein [Sphingomonas sp.]|uniref:hypothetical protein n=1 Tax=Sphingomonas sp. TaxID=28214 RepID=UPI001B039BD7|nr:hypothetical protein [Sphingomonas sp.]MBO9711290.1 hypothetical protein [Sphingomonas sp.]